MDKVSVAELENDARVADVQKHLTEPLGLEAMAINYYELAPGDSFSGGLHTHMDQEEVFYVIEGEATFETRDGEYTVGAGEVLRAAPGEYQEGKNTSDERLVALGLGAPQDSGETRVLLPCQECGDSDYYVSEVHADGVTLTCPACENVIEV